MICLGNPTICEFREAVMEFGTVIAFVPTDLIVRFWLGKGPGLDFLAGECKAVDGSRFLFGRIRIHADDRIFSSGDHKDVCTIGAGPGVSDSDWQAGVDAYLSSTTPLLNEHREVEVNGSVEEFMTKFESFAPAFGFSLGIRAIDPEEAP